MKFAFHSFVPRNPALLAIGLVVLLQVTNPNSLTAQNTISTIAGGGTPSSSPLALDLPGPSGVVKDSSGNIYFSAPSSAYVYKLSGGVVSVFASVGISGFGGDGGAATQATLGQPAGLTIDGHGNLFIADIGNSRIRKVDTAGNITTVAGNGVKCYPSTTACGDGGLAVNANFDYPIDVAVDAAGNLFIADAFDYKIRKVDAVTQNISTVAGDGTACSNPTSLCGDGATATLAQLNYPEGVAVDSTGNVYISDTKDHRIRMIAAASGIISTVVATGGPCVSPTNGCGDGGTALNAFLRLPGQISVDNSGNIYIADTGDNRVRFVNASTQVITTIAGTGVRGFGGDGASASAALLDQMIGLYVDGSGNVLLADTGNQRIRQISGGNISTIAGGGSGGDGGPAINAMFANPYAAAEDSTGNVYVVDQFNNRIRKITMPSGTVSTVVGTGSMGYSGDGGSALNATLNAPSSVALDAVGNIYIADTNNSVVRKVDAVTGNISTVAGNGQSCYPTTSACGDGGLATGANISYPIAITLDSNGNLYISDYFAHRVRKVTASTGLISTVAGTGIMGSKGNGGLATSANLNHPVGVAVDGSGNIYISDSFNNQIRRVTVSNGLINAYALTGGVCLCGNGGPALKGSMWNPLELSMDPSGNLFIGGGNDNVVQRVDVLTGTWGTVAGNPVKPTVGGFGGDGGPATSAKMANIGLAVDGKNNLYIADAANNRIRYVPMTPSAKFSAASLQMGSWPLNTASTPKSVTMSINGDAELVLSGLSITGTNAADFTQTNTCGSLPANFGPYMSCAVTVTFTPLGYGKRTASLVFTDNAPNSPQKISLVGSGPDFTVALNPTSVTVARPNSVTSTVTLTPLTGFNQAIKLGCVGAPLNSTCTVSPSSVTLDGTNPATATLTFQTTAATTAGTYSLTVKGVSNGVTHTAPLSLTVQ